MQSRSMRALTFFIWVTLLTALPLTHAHAVQCNAVFSDAVGSWSSSGEIEFKKNSKLYNSDGIIDFSTIKLPGSGGKTCISRHCQRSGQRAESLNLTSFQTTSSSQKVTINKNKTAQINAGDYEEIETKQNVRITFNGGNTWTKVKKVKFEKNTKLTMKGGTYWFEELELGENVPLTIPQGEEVTILVKKIVAKKNVKLNRNGDEGRLFLVVYDEAEFGENVPMRGYLYGLNKVILKKNAKFYGAINTKELLLNENVQVHYEDDDLSTRNFSGLCDGQESLGDPIGHWKFDQCSVTSGNDQLEDSRGNNDANVSNSVAIEQSGKRCQALKFSGDLTHVDIPFINDYALDDGALSFWMRTDDVDFSNRPSANSMTLLSKDANGQQFGGHLTIWLTDSGAINVRHQSTSQSQNVSSGNVIQENRWHHVVYTWGANGMRIYVDGQHRGTNSGFTGGLKSSQLPFTLGGNAWQVNTSSNNSYSSQLKDFF